VDLILLLVALAIGFAAGILSGMFGIGGGIIMVPALIAAGLVTPLGNTSAFAVATACSLFAIIFLSPTGSYVHLKANHLNVRYGVVLGISGVVGGVVGASVSNPLSGDWLEGGFAVFALCMGVQMAVQNGKRPRPLVDRH
jgi:hypothetical protein